MIASEHIFNPILRDIDLMYISGQISSSDADDLSKAVMWIIGNSLNESNVSHVITELRSYKDYIDSKSVSSVINNFRKTCGVYMNGN